MFVASGDPARRSARANLGNGHPDGRPEGGAQAEERPEARRHVGHSGRRQIPALLRRRPFAERARAHTSGRDFLHPGARAGLLGSRHSHRHSGRRVRYPDWEDLVLGIQWVVIYSLRFVRTLFSKDLGVGRLAL